MDGVAVVTGGASGIGAAAVRRLRRDGRRVAVLDIAPVPSGEPALAGLPAADIRDETAVEGFVAAVERLHGPVEALVNAAGVLGHMHPPGRLSMAQWDREVAVDLRGTYVCCRAVGPRLCARGRGAIVNVASVVGSAAGPVHGYGPAKAAVVQLTRSLAAEWGPFGVRVNAVSPGFTSTAALGAGLDRGALDRDALVRHAALQRLVEPDEVAAAIAFLLSGDASAVTGVDLPVDAGFLAGLGFAPYGGVRRREKPTGS